MAVTLFNGQLRSNEIYSAIYNTIISQEVFADNIAGTKSNLVDKARVDGSLFGDTKLYYATDALKSSEWGNDAEAANLLKLYRAPSPKCQAITLDKFRQIALTTDQYLSKRAWGNEGAFSSFTSVMKGWINETKRIYDSTTYNAFFGTCVATGNKQNVEFEIDDTAGAASEAQQIAEQLSDLIEQMTDVSRDFNDYEFLRSYNTEDIHVVWNSKFLHKIKKIDLPTIYHADNVMDKFGESLPERYFGKVNTVESTGNGTTIRSLVEKDLTDASNENPIHVFPGDLVPNGYKIPANESYTVDTNIICKVYVKLPPFMSSFEVATSFYNPKSLTETNYLTWGHNTLKKLDNYPFITITKAA